MHAQQVIDRILTSTGAPNRASTMKSTWGRTCPNSSGTTSGRVPGGSGLNKGIEVARESATTYSALLEASSRKKKSTWTG